MPSLPPASIHPVAFILDLFVILSIMRDGGGPQEGPPCFPDVEEAGSASFDEISQTFSRPSLLRPVCFPAAHAIPLAPAAPQSAAPLLRNRHRVRWLSAKNRPTDPLSGHPSRVPHSPPSFLVNSILARLSLVFAT